MTDPLPCEPISKDNPATIAIYKDAMSTHDPEIVDFESLADLWDFARKPEQSSAKRYSRLYARAEVPEGKRSKGNMVPPFLVALDVDASELPMTDALDRFDMMGVAAVGHPSWSDGTKGKDLHSYRILTDLIAPSWGALEDVCRQLFALIGLKPQVVDKEGASWGCFFFVPVIDSSSSRKYKAGRTDLERTEWVPRPWIKPEPAKAHLRDDRGDCDLETEASVRDAIPWINNAPRDIWVKVGMALHASGIPDARELWDEWSAGQDYADFSDEEQERVWESFKIEDGTGSVGVGSLFHMAKESGWRPVTYRPSALEDFGDILTERSRLLLELNERHAYVAVGRGVVADLGDPEEAIQLVDRNAFLGLHEFPKLPTGRVRNVKKKSGTSEEPEMVSLGRLWLSGWKGRRTYRRLGFLPEGGPETLPEDVLNSWRGWPTFPEGQGSATALLEHCHDHICAGNTLHYEWLLAWMGYFVQRPWEKIQTALCLKGKEGVGKGILGQALCNLAGPHGTYVSDSKQLVNRFNAYKETSIFIFGDEITWGGRKQEEGILKALVTEGRTQIERKWVDTAQARSFFHVCLASNEKWMVPAGPEARRWQVFEVPPNRIQDRRYFGRIKWELDNGGLLDLFQRLGALDLSSLPDPNVIISTSALAEQKIESLDSIGRWLFTVLYAGSIGDFGTDWPTRPVPVPDVRSSYVEVAREMGTHTRAIEIQINTFLREVLGPDLKICRTGARRQQSYKFPPLNECREAFEDWLGSEVNWE